MQARDHKASPLCNERWEFLGDAVLSLVITSALMTHAETRANEWDEGDLSRLRASLVNTESLAEIAREIGLGEHILVGRGERLDGGRAKTSILANTLEALFGAIYEDKGFEAASKVILRLFHQRLSSPLSPDQGMDFKTLLQERLQAAYTKKPTYKVVSEEGPAHERVFVIDVYLEKTFLARGKALGKKRASQDAAEAALKRLEQERLKL